jgi:hypothetical protein
MPEDPPAAATVWLIQTPCPAQRLLDDGRWSPRWSILEYEALREVPEASDETFVVVDTFIRPFSKRALYRVDRQDLVLHCEDDGELDALP